MRTLEQVLPSQIAHVKRYDVLCHRCTRESATLGPLQSQGPVSSLELRTVVLPIADAVVQYQLTMFGIVEREPRYVKIISVLKEFILLNGADIGQGEWS